MKINDYYSELMKQTYNDSIGINYTPMAIMCFLKDNGYLVKTTLDELSTYIYRFYADNPSFCKENSNVIISNLNKYFVSDIKTYVFEQLQVWMKNGNGVLLFDGDNVFTNIDENLSEKDKNMLSKVIESLSLRNFHKVINYSPEIEESINKLDISKLSFEEYCNVINSTKFIKRAFEELDYCVCCEEILKEELQPIHLNFDDALDDPTNSIILCKEHARLYYYKYFKFNNSGRIIIMKPHLLLDRRMHLSMKTLKNKKKYLEGKE